MPEITQAVAHACDVVVHNGLTIVGAAYCLAICIGMIRTAITGEGQQ